MDTNISNYNIEELLDVLEVKGDNVTLSAVYSKAHDNIVNLVTLDNTPGPPKSELVEFVISAFKQVCDYNHFEYSQSMIERLRQIQQDALLPPLQRSSTYNTGSHSIINHIEPETDKNFTPQYAGGVINPLRKQVNKQLVTLNSKFRNNYFKTPSTNYQYNLPNPIKNVVSMRLLSAEIPNCIYNISSALENNEFTIVSYDLSGAEEISGSRYTRTIKVRDGKYSGYALEDYLNKHVFTEDTSLNHVACLYDTTICKFRFFYDAREVSNGGAGENGSGTFESRLKVFDLDFRTQSNLDTPIQLNLGWVLGYRNAYYEYSTNYVTKTATNYKWHEGYNPESTYNELATHYLLVSVNDFNNNYSQNLYVPFQDGMMANNGLLGKIQNPASSQPVILFNDCDTDNNQIRNYYGPVNIEKLHIELLDDMGRYVDINNSDYSLTLSLETIYDL